VLLLVWLAGRIKPAELPQSSENTVNKGQISI
jgi:hypothetical protein